MVSRFYPLTPTLNLKIQVHLTYLNLRDAGLTEEGGIEVVRAIKVAGCPLKSLDLSGNVSIIFYNKIVDGGMRLFLLSRLLFLLLQGTTFQEMVS